MNIIQSLRQFLAPVAYGTIYATEQYAVNYLAQYNVAVNGTNQTLISNDTAQTLRTISALSTLPNIGAELGFGRVMPALQSGNFLEKTIGAAIAKDAFLIAGPLYFAPFSDELYTYLVEKLLIRFIISNILNVGASAIASAIGVAAMHTVATIALTAAASATAEIATGTVLCKFDLLLTKPKDGTSCFENAIDGANILNFIWYSTVHVDGVIQNVLANTVIESVTNSQYYADITEGIYAGYTAAINYIMGTDQQQQAEGLEDL